MVKAALSLNTVKSRPMKNYDKETFQVDLPNADWSSVLCSGNVSDGWEEFKSTLISLVDDIAPVRQGSAY